MATDAAARLAQAIVWWASIMLTSVPFVAGGAWAAALAQRFLQRGGGAVAFVALLSPGCDCSVTGFAAALRAGSPALAGFVLTFSAAAGPAALIATHAALGDRMVVARIVGAFIAATLTGAMWHASRPIFQTRERVACDAVACEPAFCDRVCTALAGLAVSAGCAAAVLAVAPDALRQFASPLTAALAGALLSPCSTADAVLARVLLHDRAAQAAFVIGAQCVDVRQLAMLVRVFGLRRALLAAAAGCAGCVVASMAAR